MNTRREGGFVMLAVLLLLGLMVSMVMSYSRSAVLARTQNGSQQRMVVQTVLDSGMAYANQSLQTGRSGTATITAPSGEQLAVSVSDAGSGLLNIQVSTTAQGASQLISALAEMHIGAGKDLPTLTDAARAAILASPLLIPITSDTEFKDQVIDGILLVSADKCLKLKNVVLRGAIVSANAMSDAPFGKAIDIQLKESVVIEPGSTLAGCAIIAPDAKITLSDDPRLQSHGVIVASHIKGDDKQHLMLHRQLVSSTLEDMSVGIVQLGTGRGPQSWPTVLKSGSQGITRLVFERGGSTATERNAIKAFQINGVAPASPPKDEQQAGG